MTLVHLLKEEDTAESLMQDVNTSPEELDNFLHLVKLNLVEPTMVVEICQRDDVPAQVVEALVQNKKLALYATHVQTLTVEQLEQIARIGTTETIAVLEHPNCTLKLMEELFHAATTRRMRTFIISFIAAEEEYDEYPAEWIEAVYGSDEKIVDLGLKEERASSG